VGTATSEDCHSEPASAGEESAVLSASKKQISPSGRNDKMKENEREPSRLGRASTNSSRAAAAYESSGRKSGVDKKKENNSALPKAVAGEHSSKATQTFHAFVKAGQRLAEIQVHYDSAEAYEYRLGPLGPRMGH
jgi:hypothetical protein